MQKQQGWAPTSSPGIPQLAQALVLGTAPPEGGKRSQAWEGLPPEGGERSQASGCRLTRDGGQVWPEDTGSCAETAQGCVAAPALEDEGSRGHRSLILSTSLCPCCILFGGLQWVFIAACRLSLIAASRGYSLVALCGLLIAMTSLVAEHELQSVQASVVVACGLSHCGSLS